MKLLEIGDKPLRQSRTWWGVLLLTIYAVLERYQAQIVGWIPEPWNGLVQVAVLALGIILAGVGLRGAAARAR